MWRSVIPALLQQFAWHPWWTLSAIGLWTVLFILLLVWRVRARDFEPLAHQPPRATIPPPFDDRDINPPPAA